MTETLKSQETIELSVVMPCLNEVRTLGTCIEKAQDCIRRMGIAAEVIIADNGSTDGSVALAEKHRARVVRQTQRGYGAALKAGIAAARGRYVIMGDCDDSYDFNRMEPFVEKLREGYDLVMGNRFEGGIEPGAMPFLHRYFGNPFLTWLGRLFFRITEFHDLYCGLRGFRRDSVTRLKLHSNGMEFALEMAIKCNINGLKLTEVPTTLSKDGRDRAPHLKSFRDGWRSLRFYLLMAPRWMFGLPGLLLLGFGLIVSMRLFFGPWRVGDLNFDYHSLLYSTAAVILGYQIILLGVFAKLIAMESGLHPRITRLKALGARRTLMNFVLAGTIMGVAGLILGVFASKVWSLFSLEGTDSVYAIRLVILSVLFLVLGAQNIMAGFYFGLYNLIVERRSEPDANPDPV